MIDSYRGYNRGDLKEVVINVVEVTKYMIMDECDEDIFADIWTKAFSIPLYLILFHSESTKEQK